MKKIFYLFLSFTLFFSGIQAQDCSDVTASAVATPSTCLSNGSITITWSGASINNLIEKQYSLKSTTGTLAIDPVSTNVFNNLPPGNYNLEATAFCGSLSGQKIVRTINNVTVTGSYQEPRLSFVAQAVTSSAATPSSRKSYKGCSTGLIVLFMEKGNQDSVPTFTITSAPAGVTVPQTVSATKATTGSAATGWRYTLANTWPAGIYTVSANDGCYTASTSFEIEELTTVPPGMVSYNRFRPYGDGSDCSKVYYEPSYNYSSGSYPDWYRYYSDGLFEYGIAPTGEIPKDENWFPISSFTGSYGSSPGLFDLSPGKVGDYNTTNSLTVYTRVKGCPSAITSTPTYIYGNPSMTYSTNNCTGTRTYRFTYKKSSYPYNNIYCYPLTISVTDQTTGNIVYSNSNYLYTDPDFSWDCNFGENQYLNITDASGYQIQANYQMSGGTPSSIKPSIDFNTIGIYPEYNSCDSYRRSYQIKSGDPCDNQSAFPYTLTITDDSGNVFYSETEISNINRNITGFQYGVTYTWTVVHPNWDNYTHSTTMNLKREDHIPVAFSLYRYSISECNDNSGVLRVSSGSRARSFKAGTTITITGPAGYTEQSYTFPYNIDGYTKDFDLTYLPDGEYTATIVSCGETFTAKTILTGGYTGDNIGYTLEQDCMGTKLFPSGSISLNGVTRPTVYFRMTKVPAGSGADTKVIASTSSDSFTLTTAGTYVLGMMVSNNLTGCAIKLDTIVYNPQPLTLDRDKTSAYSCTEGGTGYLTLQATNGMLPYTYSVYDKTNTTLLYGPETSSSEIDLGDFGEANETYTVRMSDACGNSFDQQVTLVSLDRAALAYGQERVCYGSPISVFGFTVTNATYSWTGPNGFSSTEKNPVIPNATEVNEGWYKVRIKSLTCEITVEDSIYVAVYDPVNIAHLDGTTQEITLCPYQALVISQTASGGSNNFTYQWAYSSNGTTYYNISGQTTPTFTATSTSYIFTSTIANPSYRYIRLTVTDASCGTYNLYYHTNVRGCMYLINPDLRSPGLP